MKTDTLDTPNPLELVRATIVNYAEFSEDAKEIKDTLLTLIDKVRNDLDIKDYETSSVTDDAHKALSDAIDNYEEEVLDNADDDDDEFDDDIDLDDNED